jgi:hypothetical protein
MQALSRARPIHTSDRARRTDDSSLRAGFWNCCGSTMNARHSHRSRRLPDFGIGGRSATGLPIRLACVSHLQTVQIQPFRFLPGRIDPATCLAIDAFFLRTTCLYQSLRSSYQAGPKSSHRLKRSRRVISSAFAKCDPCRLDCPTRLLSPARCVQSEMSGLLMFITVPHQISSSSSLRRNRSNIAFLRSGSVWSDARQRRLTSRWGGRVKDKVPSPNRGARTTQLSR